jgi:hypothetical protein
MAAGDVTAVRSKASDVYSAASFDGVDDYVEIPHHASQLGENLSYGFTISTWIFVNKVGASTMRIVDKTTNSFGLGGFSLRLDNTTQKVGFRINADSIILSNAINLKKWYHIIITCTPGKLGNFYINGTLSGSANQNVIQPISAITTTNALRIGNRSTAVDFPLDGCIKDVKMWNRVLTSDEIAADYAGTNITEGQILWVPLKDDYNDKSTLGLTGTNSGTFLTNTLTNKIKADMTGLNLGAATDKIIALPRRGSPTIVTANRAAA